MELPRMCPARWLSDQNFGMSVPPHDFLYQFYDMHSNYFRPWKYGQDILKEFGSTIENEKGNFKITLDVQYFRPNEITVKVANSEIVVEGRHEERPDTHGFVTRQFKRRYPLPSQYPPENVTSTLSSDGVLTIIAEKKMSVEVEKIIPIKMCAACPRKNQVETNYTSEMTQKMQKENIKEAEDILSNNKCPTFKAGIMKETSSETNGTCTKIEATKASTEVIKTERTDPLTNKIEESIGKSILGLTALTEQLGHSSLASTTGMSSIKSDIKTALATTDMKSKPEMSDLKNRSETSGIKIASEITGIKGAAEMSGINSALAMTDTKTAAEVTGMKSTLETSEMNNATTDTSGIKSAAGMSGMKNTSEMLGIKNASEMSGMKSATEMSGMKCATEMSGNKNATETLGIISATEMSGMKSATGMSGMKSALEMSNMKSALDSCGMKSLDMCGMKGLSKMLVEESSSSYKSSSSMSSSSRMTGKTVETISDITAELREAAENV